uniref:Uncharacterized protein n=1 Tax=Lactuca sativa TaxID=4236 RepID=A0A9R1VDN4_LACSA|nr:hypothetical protein LSAT_V11C500288990 [Lactuca sativa]
MFLEKKLPDHYPIILLEHTKFAGYFHGCGTLQLDSGWKEEKKGIQAQIDVLDACLMVDKGDAIIREQRLTLCYYKSIEIPN